MPRPRTHARHPQRRTYTRAASRLQPADCHFLRHRQKGLALHAYRCLMVLSTCTQTVRVMKLLLDDKTTRGYDLNANEACIFAAILKCTRAGRGWYGNYRELAAAMPFVMSHETARRAVQKLLNLGLIERREEKLFALTQNVTDNAQNVTEPTQNVTSDAQNVLPPNNPPIYN